MGAGGGEGVTLCLFVGIAIVMLSYALARGGSAAIPAMRAYWRRADACNRLQRQFRQFALEPRQVILGVDIPERFEFD